MPTANEFVRKAQDYIGDRASLQQFADWIGRERSGLR